VPIEEVDVPSVAVVICVYTERRWDDIVGAVESVDIQAYPGRVQTVVIVDHNDALLERCRQTFNGAMVAPSEGTKGLAGARNTGAAATDADIVVFLDDDAAAEPGWLAALVEPYGDPDVIGTGGTILARWPGVRPAWFPEEFDWVVGCSYRGLPETRAEVRNMIGASMSLRAAVFDKAGPFTESLGRVDTLPLGCEETEMCIRARAVIPGAKVIHVPESKVRHRVSADRVSPRYFFRRCWSEGISKGWVAKLAGAEAALATERTYSTRTLPTGVVMGVVATARGDRFGVVRSFFIISGFVVTVAGYISVARRRRVVTSTPGGVDQVAL
jgi:glycosyltransferase involved in cell wall biosynthesis